MSLMDLMGGEKSMQKPEQTGTVVTLLTAEQLREIVSTAVREALGAQKPHEGYLDIDQAAAYLSTTASAVQAAVTRGTLVPDCRGSRGRTKGHRFTRRTLDAFMRIGAKP
jgi:hypothetical protein